MYITVLNLVVQCLMKKLVTLSIVHTLFTHNQQYTTYFTLLRKLGIIHLIKFQRMH